MTARALSWRSECTAKLRQTARSFAAVLRLSRRIDGPHYLLAKLAMICGTEEDHFCAAQCSDVVWVSAAILFWLWSTAGPTSADEDHMVVSTERRTNSWSLITRRLGVDGNSVLRKEFYPSAQLERTPFRRLQAKPRE
ncbi:hypothetical protein DENSPDRAFT_841324 [Dentipellis sp. KUC8613]|nr:hypothetical protein DENSPDRAFT_841324 [Dentipellis sp. KUC8613]